jgi:hypothetical protein
MPGTTSMKPLRILQKQYKCCSDRVNRRIEFGSLRMLEAHSEVEGRICLVSRCCGQAVREYVALQI